MADGNHQDDEPFVLNLTKDAVVLNPVSPQTCQYVPKRLSKQARIIGSRDPRLHLVENLLLD